MQYYETTKQLRSPSGTLMGTVKIEQFGSDLTFRMTPLFPEAPLTVLFDGKRTEVFTGAGRQFRQSDLSLRKGWAMLVVDRETRAVLCSSSDRLSVSDQELSKLLPPRSSPPAAPSEPAKAFVALSLSDEAHPLSLETLSGGESGECEQAATPTALPDGQTGENGEKTEPVALPDGGNGENEQKAEPVALSDGENRGNGEKAEPVALSDGENGENGENGQKAEPVALPVQMQTQILPTGSDQREEYDDERIAEESYFPAPTDDTYYRSVKGEVDESFFTLPRFEGFETVFADALFVRSGRYLLGKIFRLGRVQYLLFGAERIEHLPEKLREKARFVPLSLFTPERGYYFLFQSAADGEIL
ncbi:MAG: hypothetical protein ACI4U2_06195 [Christensenellaceae bacterium]